MPIFEFKCRNCKTLKEKTYKYNEKPRGIICSKCGDIAPIIPSLGNFHLVGGGWADENYGNKKII